MPPTYSPLVPSVLPLDFDDLPTSEKRRLLKSAMWSNLKSRLRDFTLQLRADGAQLADYLSSAAHDHHASQYAAGASLSAAQASSKGKGGSWGGGGGGGSAEANPPPPPGSLPCSLPLQSCVSILRALQFPFLGAEDAAMLAPPPSPRARLYAGPAKKLLCDLILEYGDEDILKDKFVNLGGVSRGLVVVKDLMDSLELSPPPDFADPDRTFVDFLPQPYRLITKVVDGLFDDVWNTLRERHPPLKELPVAQPELYGLGGKRKIVEVKEAFSVAASAALHGIGTVTATSWSANGHFLAVGTSMGHLLLLNPKGCVPQDVAGHKSAKGLLEAGAGTNLVSLDDASNVVLAQASVFTDIPFGVSHVSKVARFRVGSGGVKCVRIALCAPFELPVEEAAADKDATDKKATDKKKESAQAAVAEPQAPLPKACVSKLVVVELWPAARGDESGASLADAVAHAAAQGAGQGGKAGGRHKWNVRVLAVGQTASPTVGGGLTLSDDGLHLAVAGQDGALEVWALPRAVAPPVVDETGNVGGKGKGKKGKMKAINEGRGGTASGRSENDEDLDEDEFPPDPADLQDGKKGAPGADVPIVYDLGLPSLRVDPPKGPEEQAREEAAAAAAAAAAEAAAGKGAKGAEPPAVAPETVHTRARRRSPLVPSAMFLTGPPPGRVTLSSAGAQNKMGGSASIVVWRSGSNAWRQYKLLSFEESEKALTASESAAGAIDAAASKSGADKGKAAAAPAKGSAPPATDALRTSRIPEAKLSCLGRWLLSSPITCSAMYQAEDGASPLMAFGCEDGTVVLWDSKTNTPVGGCSRHQGSSVSSLCLCSGGRYLVSGAADGTVHFHDLDVDATARLKKGRETRVALAMSASQSTLGSRMSNRGTPTASGVKKTAEQGSVASEAAKVAELRDLVLSDPREKLALISRRFEDFSSPVVSISAMKGLGGGVAVGSGSSICVVMDQDGVCVVYDAGTGDLVGKLSPLIGRPGMSIIDSGDSNTPKPLRECQALSLCKRKGMYESVDEVADGVVESAVSDPIRAALSEKSLLGCGSDCITVVCAPVELQQWRPTPPSVSAGSDPATDATSLSRASSTASLSAEMSVNRLTIPSTYLCVYSLGDVFTACCPGLSKACLGTGLDATSNNNLEGEQMSLLGGAAARNLAVSLFPLLTPEQRKNPKLAITPEMLGANHANVNNTSVLGGSAPGSRQNSRLLHSRQLADTDWGGKEFRATMSPSLNHTHNQSRTGTHHGIHSAKSVTSSSGLSEKGAGHSNSAKAVTGAAGGLNPNNLASMLGAGRSQGKLDGIAWNSDPVQILSKNMKSGGLDGGREGREARIKKRREELLNALS